ncbi:MAG: CUAEP/CCAEP-tail radical SAM (seleno)protein, partial [Acidimicrobiales bacterium]
RPHHALRVARAVHRAFPHLTFDATVKVEHVLRHEGVWPELAGLGCLFVVSAFECVDDATLAKLDKGHTTADASRSVALLRDEGIEVRPSFMPFTPWTSLGQIVDLFDWVAAHDLVGNVDPVQYSIRLLVPEGSLLLGRDDLDPHLGPYDPDALTWTWHHPDPRVDALQVTLASLAARSGAGREPMEETYSRMRAEVVSAAGSPPVGRRAPASSTPPEGRAGRTGVGRRPRLTEPWFC